MISVVLPCFNAEESLDACLDSLLAQTGADFEVIAVNDGSADGSLDVLRRYERLDRRVRVFDRVHTGVVGAMNFGMSQCRGGYIARMDSDDVCLPGRLTLQQQYLDKHSEIGLVGGRVRFGGDATASQGYKAYVDWTNSLVRPREISLARFVESPFANPSIMFRKELVSRYGAFYDGPFPEDYEFLLRLMQAGVAMAKVDEEVLIWNDPPTRLSRNDPRYDPEAFYRIKAGYLAGWLKSQGIQTVTVIGGGRITRRRALMLAGHDVEVSSWVEVDPAKIGQTVHGRLVRDWRELQAPDGEFMVSFVGNRGARERIVRELSLKGWIEGLNFLLAA